MKSKLAAETRRDRARRVRQMSAEERLAIALELGERAIQDYMHNFSVNRREAVSALRRAVRAGRRRAACMEEDPDERPVRSGG